MEGGAVSIQPEYSIMQHYRAIALIAVCLAALAMVCTATYICPSPSVKKDLKSLLDTFCFNTIFISQWALWKQIT